MQENSENETQKWYAPTTREHGPQRFAIVPMQFLLDPNPVLRCRTAQMMFLALCQYVNSTTGLVGGYNAETNTYRVPTIKTIAKIAGVNYTSGSRVMWRLEKSGWIRVQRRMCKASIIYVQIPKALDVINEAGDFSYKDELLSAEEFIEYRAELDEKAAKNDRYGVCSAPEVAPISALKEPTDESGADQAESNLVAENEKSSPSKPPRIYRQDAIRDVANYIVSGVRNLSDADVGRFSLTYSMSESELRELSEGFEYVLDKIFS